MLLRLYLLEADPPGLTIGVVEGFGLGETIRYVF
jgi:hypothetical protein